MNSTSFWTQLQHKAVIRGYCIKAFIKQYRYIIKNLYLTTLFIIYIKKVKNNQHETFPSGHPPEYYSHLNLLNFAERTGCSVLKLIWPIIQNILRRGTRSAINYYYILFACL
jgi:hypothetical protein